HEVRHAVLFDGVLDERDRDARELGGDGGHGDDELVAGHAQLLRPLLGLLDHRVGGGAELCGRARDARAELLGVALLIGLDHGGVHLGDDPAELLGGLHRGGSLGLLAGRGRGRRLGIGPAGREEARGEQPAGSQDEAATADGSSAHEGVLPRAAQVVAGHRCSSSSMGRSCSVRSGSAGASAGASSSDPSAGASSSAPAEAASSWEASAPSGSPVSSSVAVASSVGLSEGVSPSAHTLCSRDSSAAITASTPGSAAVSASLSASASALSASASASAAPEAPGAEAAAPAAEAVAAAGAGPTGSRGSSASSSCSSSSRRRPPSETTSSTRPITAIAAPPA